MPQEPVFTYGQMGAILTKVVAVLEKPSAFAQHDLSCDSDGQAADVWSSGATQRDALGWILKTTYDHRYRAALQELKSKAYKFSEVVNAEVLRITGRSLVAISEDDGREAIRKVLKEIAQHYEELESAP